MNDAQSYTNGSACVAAEGSSRVEQLVLNREK